MAKKKTLTLADRLWPKVQKTDSCWEWLAYRTPDGYGTFWDGTRSVLAHRFVYELFVEPIPDSLQIDHLCRNRGCVNPDHMEIVDLAENVLRGIGLTAVNATKAFCDHGHEFTPENTYRVRNGHRQCRVCRNRAKRDSYHRLKLVA